MPETTILEQVKSYNACGLKVMPLHRPINGVCSCGNPECSSVGKHPALPKWKTPDGQYQPEIRLQHENTLQRWFGDNSHNVAILTGRVSGIVVLDIDSEEGEQNVKAKGAPENGPQVITAKGRHIYFAYPTERLGSEQEMKNFVRGIGGVDFRGDGGYVVAPPSLHVSGHEYRWKDDSFSLPLPQCPDWLFELAAKSNNAYRKDSVSQKIERYSGGNCEKFPQSQRNNLMFRELSKLRSVSRFSDKEIYRTAVLLNQSRCEPPLNTNELELIIGQVCKYKVGWSNTGNGVFDYIDSMPIGDIPADIENKAATKQKSNDAITRKTPSSPKQESVLDRIDRIVRTFDPDRSSKPEFIAGLFRRGYPSLLVAEPGLGKTLLMERLMCDLSVGGPIFDGFSSSGPKTTLMFSGEAGLEMLGERLKSTGWKFDGDRIKILDSRDAWSEELFPALDSSEGRDIFKQTIEKIKPDLVVVDSLGSFVDDESDRESMKAVFDFLISMGDRNKCALLLIHHLRKRKNNERTLPLALSEVIGSSVITRHSALVIGMEKRSQCGVIPAQATNIAAKDEIIVRHLKTWDKPFPPFTFEISNSIDDNGKEQLRVKFNLAPSLGEGKQSIVWNAILEHYGDGAKFQRSYLEHVCTGVSSDYIKRLLSEWVNLGRLERFGANRATSYRIITAHGDLLPARP